MKFKFCTKTAKVEPATEAMLRGSVGLGILGPAPAWLSQWQTFPWGQWAPCPEIRDNGDGLANPPLGRVNFNYFCARLVHITTSNLVFGGFSCSWVGSAHLNLSEKHISFSYKNVQQSGLKTGHN